MVVRLQQYTSMPSLQQCTAVVPNLQCCAVVPSRHHCTEVAPNLQHRTSVVPDLHACTAVLGLAESLSDCKKALIKCPHPRSLDALARLPTIRMSCP